MTATTTETALDVLRDRFGFDAFRPGQKQVIEALLAGRSALAVFPTGGGKSLCYAPAPVRGKRVLKGALAVRQRPIDAVRLAADILIEGVFANAGVARPSRFSAALEHLLAAARHGLMGYWLGDETIFAVRRPFGGHASQSAATGEKRQSSRSSTRPPSPTGRVSVTGCTCRPAWEAPARPSRGHSSSIRRVTGRCSKPRRDSRTIPKKR